MQFPFLLEKGLSELGFGDQLSVMRRIMLAQNILRC